VRVLRASRDFVNYQAVSRQLSALSQKALKPKLIADS
jgi:hypothetical protein